MYSVVLDVVSAGESRGWDSEQAAMTRGGEVESLWAWHWRRAAVGARLASELVALWTHRPAGAGRQA